MACLVREAISQNMPGRCRGFHSLKGVPGADPRGDPEGVILGVISGVAPGVRRSVLRAWVSSRLSALSGTSPYSKSLSVGVTDAQDRALDLGTDLAIPALVANDQSLQPVQSCNSLPSCHCACLYRAGTCQLYLTFESD